jgi:hypothetical protein
MIQAPENNDQAQQFLIAISRQPYVILKIFIRHQIVSFKTVFSSLHANSQKNAIKTNEANLNKCIFPTSHILISPQTVMHEYSQCSKIGFKYMTAINIIIYIQQAQKYEEGTTAYFSMCTAQVSLVLKIIE